MMIMKTILFLISVSEIAKGFDDIFPTLPVTVQNSSNVLCKRHSSEYMENLKNFTLWAYEMRDASAKSTTGVLRGNMNSMGNFQQCITSRAPFPTQYCLVILTVNVPKLKTYRDPYSLYFDPNDPVTDKLYKFDDVSRGSRNVVKMGWCIPSSCSALDSEKYLNEYLRNIDHVLKENNITYTAQLPQVLCQSSNQHGEMDGVDIVFCMLTLVLILLVIVATCWEYNKEVSKSTKKSLLYKMFIAFSARQNFLNLNRKESSDKALSILYGIKVLSILMVIFGHRNGLYVASGILNLDYIETSYRNPWLSFLSHSDLFVDTFFIISGILVVYGVLNLFDKKYMNPGIIIVMRYLRLTPAFAYVIFFTATIYYQTGTGPLWNVIIGSERTDCRKNWWTNLLYVMNYVNSDSMCVVHTWYLACDFHYFIIAVAVVLLIRKGKNYGLSALVLLTIISIVVPFAIIYIYQRPPFLRFYTDFLAGAKKHPDLLITYIKSHTRASPYVVGMCTGYLYYRMKGSENVMSKWYSRILITVSTFLLLFSLFSGAIFYNPYHDYNALESAAYGAFHRFIWALGSCGLMYAASYGTSRFVFNCLSWRPLIPLSKLVFGAYLWHFLFITRSVAITSDSKVFTYFDAFLYGFSDACLAFILALALYLAVEAPLQRIVKEIMSPSRAEKNENDTTNHPPNKEENSRL